MGSDEAREFDVIVIGAGPAGENVADRVVRAGLTCAVVEAELVGGECSYWACIPSKALLRPVELRAATSRLSGLSPAELDVKAAFARRDAFTGYHRDAHDGHHDDSGQVRWIESLPATFVRGHGRLTGERSVAVHQADGGVTALRAQHAVVLATGTRAAVPDTPGLRAAKPWTSREATSASHVPRRLAVIGGGVVACEMAQAYRGLGAEDVTIIIRGDRLLTRSEPFAGELLADSLVKQGVLIRRNATPASVERADPGGPVRIRFDDGAGLLEADELLVATGRVPQTDDLGLETVGLRPGEYVPVDDSLRSTELDWLYAVGDVNGRNLLTHMGKYQARVCGNVIGALATGGDDSAFRAIADRDATPQVVFTDPQVTSVGLTEAQARKRAGPIRTVEYEIGNVSGASLLADGYTGRAKIIVDEERRIVLGATFVGPEIAELLHSATVAVVGKVPLDTLWHAVPSFPTASEVWLRLLEKYGL